MKFAKAALLYVVSTSAAAAFSPNNNVRQFGIQHHHYQSTPPQASTRKTKTALRSATDEDLFKGLHNNRELEGEIAELVTGSGIKPPRPVSQLDRQTLERKASQSTRSSITKYMKQYEGLSGAAAVYLKLLENGVDVVNGYSGGAVLPLLDQFHPDNPRHQEIGREPIRWITNSNEASAGHIAEGYAKSMPVNGKHLPVGVAIATSGPGVTNLITPLQDGICDGVPMVVLCGQAATTAPPDAFQSAPAVEMTKPCTKWSYQIKSAAEVPFVMDYAFFVARNGRPGPVFVDLPKDLQNQIITPEAIDGYVNTMITDQANDDLGMASLKTEFRPDGELFKAIRLGYEDKGLSFDLASNGHGGLGITPVPSTDDTYNADHHPTNKVIWTTNALTGEPEPITKEGPLDPSDEITAGMLQLIKRAKKPVIIAGQGCNDSAEELKQFAEALQIPVTTTLHALGCFDERHDLALNMVGMHGHPTPNFMVQEADLIINIGSRFDDRITGRMSDFVPGAKKAADLGVGGIIHVDIRLTEKAKQIEPHFFVHSTAKNFLQTMNAALAAEPPQTEEWIQRMKSLQAEYPITIPTFPTQDTKYVDEEGKEQARKQTMMSAQRVITELNRQILDAGMMDDAIFTTGVGIHQMVAAQLITWTQPRQMLSSGSLGTMGVSLGYCIGAKLANCGKLVISIDGDGSFNMTFTELKTVAEQGIPIKIIILDNESQMMVEYWQRLFHDDRLLAVRNKNPNYTMLASSFGIKSIYCDREEDIEEKMREFLFEDNDQPVLFHVRINRTPCLPLVAPGQPLDEMILEDVEVEVDPGAAPS